MKPSSREPTYQHAEQDAADRSPIAREFLSMRANLNAVVTQADNSFLKRLYNLDHNAYLEGGALSARTKELMGLAVSAALRCDDCISYHVIQAWRLGASRPEIQESIDVAALIGGTIVVPHLRRAYALLTELFAAPQS